MTEKFMGEGFDLVIEPNRTTGAFFRELLRYRELFPSPPAPPAIISAADSPRNFA